MQRTKLLQIIKEEVQNILTELRFKDQAAFERYKSKHKMRPTTKVTIAGKETTVGQASSDGDEEKTKKQSTSKIKPGTEIDDDNEMDLRPGDVLKGSRTGKELIYLYTMKTSGYHFLIDKKKFEPEMLEKGFKFSRHKLKILPYWHFAEYTYEYAGRV